MSNKSSLETVFLYCRRKSDEHFYMYKRMMENFTSLLSSFLLSPFVLFSTLYQSPFLKVSLSPPVNLENEVNSLFEFLGERAQGN